ncbi:response regulator [Clostridium cylindrosporum]|uniref:Stage 0 sporulation protein A homolog n=1 Tax=Clostridium cylindrosporum DSM 605 TaxID=1121307 RepID=A0A0J8G293_CLOCY|nr:response regulator [Clostridium cylindrosporum]KMT21861.1 hypothetical protein CLCY_3c01320 [Clostridium cylindrosporum DSM 605]
MRTIIIDDEKPILDLMKIMISKNKNLEIVGEFTSSKEALVEIQRLMPDVIFVDIEMPYMNGIEFAEKVEKLNQDIQIVFITAYENYAIDAFKVNAVNYILKPINEEDIDTTVSRLLKNRGLNTSNEVLAESNKIYCLGHFKVYGKDGCEIEKWYTSKVQEAFAYFIYKGGEGVDKWQLCEVLWEDSPPKKAESNLHSTIYRLKRVLKNAAIENKVINQGGKYKMDFTGFSCDLWEFLSFMKKNPRVNGEGIENYKKIIDLYNGSLFGSKDYVWAVELNEKINRYYSYGVKNIANYYIDMENYNEAYEYLRKLIEVNPFDEDAHELIIRVHFLIGDRIGLISHYTKMVEIFEKELDIPIKESTRKLYREMLGKL